MHRIEIDLSMTTGGLPPDAARIAGWIAEAIEGQTGSDRDATSDRVVVHAIRVEDVDA